MKYEKINKNYTKTIIICFIVIIIIGSVLVLNITKAKYKTTVSVPIVSGTIKYDGNADLNVMAVYQQKEDSDCTDDICYDNKNEIPQNGYVLNKDKSYCTIPGSSEKLKNVVSYKTNILSVNMTKKGTKCYLYFDVSVALKAILDVSNVIDETPHFDKTSCATGCDVQENGLYKTLDDFGDSYYYRGTVNDNWVQFGNMSTSGNSIYWRIIRINGDGTIRLIYAGNGTSGTSLLESDGRIGATNYKFNASHDNNRFVGYQYGDNGQQRGNSHDSNAYTQLKNWFETNLKDEFALSDSKIDKNVGFCNDRSASTKNNDSWSEDMSDSGGTGTDTTSYGAYLRLVNSTKQPIPTFKCGTNSYKNEDYFTYTGAIGIQAIENGKIVGTQSLDYPVGLITADEVSFAGGVYNQDNTGYWLHTNSAYYTMSPYRFERENYYAREFIVNSSGNLNNYYMSNTSGLRPVINLKADAKFIFAHEDQAKGTSSNPYIVS